MFFCGFAIINIHEAKLCCSQSRPTSSARDWYVTHYARLRVCYVTQNHHTFSFVLFYLRLVRPRV